MDSKSRLNGAVQLRPSDWVISAWWKDAICGVKELGWKVKTLRKGEVAYTTNNGRVGTLLLEEYDDGIWRLSVDFAELRDGMTTVEPSFPGEWQGEFTCMAAELGDVCARLPAWLRAHDHGTRGPLLPGMAPWVGNMWTDDGRKDYERRCTDDGLWLSIEEWDRDALGVVNAWEIAKELGLNRNRVVQNVGKIMHGRAGWEQVKPYLWRRVYSDEWILRILREIGPNGMCDTPGILVKTWHGYDRKEHEKLEEYMQGMKVRGLVTATQKIWWRAVNREQ